MVGFFMGVAAVIVIVIQLSSFFAPPEQSSASVIGEIAAEIRLSAKRALSGEPAAESTPAPREYGHLVTVMALCLAGGAVLLGGLGLYRHEPHRLSYLALGFGTSAFIMQYVFWLALLMCGVALLVAIIGNLDGILGG
ncbi:MAG: hypothetical protein WBA67_08520 [Jannaschia sp.]